MMTVAGTPDHELLLFLTTVIMYIQALSKTSYTSSTKSYPMRKHFKKKGSLPLLNGHALSSSYITDPD